MARNQQAVKQKKNEQTNQKAARQPIREEVVPDRESIPVPLIDVMAQTMESADQTMTGDISGIAIDLGSRAQTMQSLQRMYGNRAAHSWVQRQTVDAGPVDAGTPVAGVPDADTVPEDLRAFRAGGPYPAVETGTTVTPSTGMGGFNARYDPASMVLTITLNIGFNFVNGMNISGDTVTAAENSMAGSATSINRMLSRLRGERKQQALDQVREQWQWTGATDPRITTWMAGYKSNVEGVWSSSGTGIVLQGSRAGWENQLVNVNVVVNTTNITSLAAGAPIPGPQPVHCQSTIYKTPDEDVFGAFVDPGASDNATDQRLELGSGQITAQSHLLQQGVVFDNNSSTLTPAAQDRLRRIIISFQAPSGGAGTTIDITGHANTVGEETEAGRQRNIQLADERAQAVDNFLRTTVVEGSTLANATTRIQSVVGTGATGATSEGRWRRVDISFAGGQGQNIAAHEFGHMIGLGDEYASTPTRDASGNIVTDANGDPITRGVISGTGGDVGGATDHDALARDMGLSTGAVFENNDNIMSLGSTVRPQHYATFVQALRNVTSVNDWQLRR